MGRWRKVAGVSGAVIAVGAVGLAGLVAYLLATAESRLSFPDTPTPAIAASTDPEMIARGRYLAYGPAHCSQCHSTPDRARPDLMATSPLSGGMVFAMGPIGTTWSANLTPDPSTGIGRRTDGELARAVRTGVLHDGSLSFFMRYSAATPSDEDLAAILSFLRSQEPVSNAVPRGEWYAMGKLMLGTLMSPAPRSTPAPAHVPEPDEPSVARGEYLAEYVALCVACHSTYDMATFEPQLPKAGGGIPEASHGDDHDMEFVTPNLTSHPTGMTGKLSEDEFVERMRRGRAYASSIMPWEGFQQTSETDLRSIYRYLRSLPPVDNDVGPTYRKLGWTPEGD